MNIQRVRSLNTFPSLAGPVVYWMSRDQRVLHNWALIRVIELAQQKNQSVIVVFCSISSFLHATQKQYSFMFQGLQIVESELGKLNIPFYLLEGDPAEKIPDFLHQIQAGALVTDFSPLHISQKWKKHIAAKISVAFEEVDTHNIVPVWITSQKQEFGAYTIRPKIHKLLPEFMDEFPVLHAQKTRWVQAVPNIKWQAMITHTKPYTWISSGQHHAQKALETFITHKLRTFDELRNDPSLDGQSNLSPYLHFGQLSSQFMAMQILKSNSNKTSFLEESIVRKELSDNFCYYNPNYDSFEGFPTWAQNTLNEHRHDTREFTYDLKRFDDATTHDDLWNAAQLEMKIQGKMHGYMRMYWAKKILEWSPSPEIALKTAIFLNDTYELDGRDPNGYTGIAWSIGGVHDRAWAERPVFGKIRYMNYNGAKRKFNIASYINKWTNNTTYMRE